MAAQQGRKRADEALVMALVCGATVENAAHTAGVSVRTAYRRLRNPEFRQRLQQAQGDMVQRTAAALTAGAMGAVKALLELVQPSHQGAVRLGAARAMLDLGLKLREAADLGARVAALEERLQAKLGTRA
jgi:hypothetical protein